MSKNVCPHCGSELLLFEEPSELRNEVQAYCDRCIASGPWELTEEEAIAAFCRPAHLVAEYDAKITQRDAQIERLRTAHQNGGGALLDAAFAALERWMEDQ